MEKTNAIAIVLDDHLLFADSFAALIERLELFSDVHILNDKKELTKFIIKHSKKSVYLFLDYYLKNENGLMLINEIKRLNRQLRIIIMSSTISPAVVTSILDYKPQGFISKSSGFDTILQCLTTIADGHQYLCPVISRIVDQIDNTKKIAFTSRELEILQYFAQGLSIAHTAEKTYLSKHTIVAHRRNMMAKINVNSITELLSYAREQELI
ncbi:two component transcriptional regulator, LuxR family [Pedobacter sp. ok626]|uniref:response regulator transcription factor n=1 Tax=Pedobacter sp. ok626 TaxID=1761882 RepID=UPI0008813A31|nr:response regulator transcription factor [Pedobacter sp. ok626]SDL98534.1 two component transcriptional regulator, LuxR family [Pedobacter sp. ok626]